MVALAGQCHHDIANSILGYPPQCRLQNRGNMGQILDRLGGCWLPLWKLSMDCRNSVNLGYVI